MAIAQLQQLQTSVRKIDFVETDTGHQHDLK
jgi:hypothetical protein